MAGGPAHAHAAIGVMELELGVVIGILLQRTLDQGLHTGAVVRLDVADIQLKRRHDAARRIAKTGIGFIAPVQLARGDHPLPVAHLGQLRGLLHAPFALFGIGNVVEDFELADRAVRVVERHVEQVVSAPLGRSPLPMHGLPGKNLLVLAPVAARGPAMKILVALAALDRPELPLQRRVEVFDIKPLADDVNPIGQDIQNTQQPRAVGRQLLGQRLHALDFADVGPGQDDSAVQAAVVLERQHALVHPAPVGQPDLALDPGLVPRTALQFGHEGILRPEPVADFTHRTAHVAAAQGQKLAHRRAETPQLQSGIQKDNADLGAVQQLVVIAVQRGQFRVLALQFMVECVQVLVDRLEFLIGALQLLVGGRQLLIPQVQPLMAGLQFQHHFLQALTRGQQFGLQHFGRLAGHAGQRHLGLQRNRLGTERGYVDQTCQRHRLLAEQLVRAIHGGEGLRLQRPHRLAGTEQQDTVRLEGKVQLRQRLDLRLRLEVDQQVAAHDQVDARERGIVQQVVPRKHHMAAQGGIDPHAPEGVAHKISPQERIGHHRNGLLAVLTARSLFQHIARNVRGKHLHIAGVPHAPGHVQSQHGQRVGFFPAGAPRRPDAQIVTRVPAAQEVREHLVGQACKHRRVAEKLGHVDQQVAAQSVALGLIVTQTLQVRGAVGGLPLDHPVAHPARQRGGLVPGEIDRTAPAQQVHDGGQLGQRLVPSSLAPLAGVFRVMNGGLHGVGLSRHHCARAPGKHQGFRACRHPNHGVATPHYTARMRTTRPLPYALPAWPLPSRSRNTP